MSQHSRIYTVGWICALRVERNASKCFLEKTHEPPPQSEGDRNSYTFGEINGHNIVMALLPMDEYGTSTASLIAANMLRSFPDIRIALLVGIGGGAPYMNRDIRLGDVVVSTKVVQHDYGKRIQGQRFAVTGHLDKPPQSLRLAIQTLHNTYDDAEDGNGINSKISAILANNPRRVKVHSRPATKDVLYAADALHPDPHSPCEEVCIQSQMIDRKPRDNDQDDVCTVHYGLIASGNTLLRDADVRNWQAKHEGIFCFEMEAAGLMNTEFKCLVIRGICDYCDTHKNKDWQGYAAMAAAAYARDLLQVIQPSMVEAERKMDIKLLKYISATVSEIKEDVTRSRYVLDHQEDRKVLEWLTPLEYGPQHSDYLGKRQPGTGQWLLDSEEYQAWLVAPQQTLFCPGMPGAGKTFLTSTVIDDLERRFGDDNTSAIAYVYCNFKRKDDQKIGDLSASLLRQIVSARPSLPAALQQLYDKNVRKGTRPTLEEMIQVLHSVISEFSRVFVVVDALDECQTSDDCRGQLLSMLFKLQAERAINLFATSRQIPEISEMFAGKPFREIRASDFDIRRYLEGHIPQLGAFVTEKKVLKDEIVTQITGAVDGMFLLAQLYLESLQGKRTPKAIRKALSGMVPGAHGDTAYNIAYANAMERIEGQLEDCARSAKQVLGWIVHAKRQLRSVELQHALAVEHNESALDPDNYQRIEDLVSVCAGLVVVDEQSGIIRLVHYTAQEYFNSTKANWFPEMELHMTITCTTYLSFDSFATGPCQTDEDFEKRTKEHCLYSYAAQNWGLHARAASLDDRVLSFLSQQAQVDAASQALLASDRGWRYEGYSQSVLVLQRTALHLASFFGLVWAVDRIGHKDSVDVEDTTGQTSLHVASQGGHLEVARLLIDKGADIKGADNDGWTPLYGASQGGHLEVARLLIDEGADVKGADNNGRTPLYRASQGGHLEVVRLLIDEGADIKGADNDGRTPLYRASQGGHLEVVRLLIDKGANIKGADNDRWTPLYRASQGGHLEVARLLIDKGADVKGADNDGWTPLHVASQGGHLEVARLLIDKGADQ